LTQIHEKIFVKFCNIISVLNHQIDVFQTSAYLITTFEWVFETQCSLVLKKKDLRKEKYSEVAQESCLHWNAYLMLVCKSFSAVWC